MMMKLLFMEVQHDHAHAHAQRYRISKTYYTRMVQQ